MCCRYLLLRDALRELLAQSGVLDEDGVLRGENFADRYNIAPGARIPVVRMSARARAGARFTGFAGLEFRGAAPGETAFQRAGGGFVGQTGVSRGGAVAPVFDSGERFL